ncbi:hypothetical protein [Paenibacillus maysiensis]|uniref:hypothetical protein n=1 Tax=Paenibacillus maysiensis TaxID=1155954 RepID=UPI000471A6EA|nr:hypothetical protein [Paenibacillus maysiensis]
MNYLKYGRICCVLLLLISCVVLNGCTKGNDSSTTETNHTLIEQQSYELIQEKYSENGIIIKYPQITKLKDAEKQKSLNQILKNEALKGLHEYGDSDSGVHLEIDYEIKRQSERFLSVQYTGVRYVKDAAYPNHIFYTTNLDMKQALRLRLSDLVKIEKPFIELLKNGKITAVQPEQKGLIGDFTQDELNQWLTSADVPEGSAEESELDTFSYLTSDSLGVSIPVAHAVGDHAEYEIRFAQIPDGIKQNKELWQEINPVVDQSATVVNGGELDTDQFNIDEQQSFETSFEGWGHVKFVSTVGMIEEARGNYFFLLDEQGYILYSFPEFYGNNWSGEDGLAAVAFKDVNKDGLKDVIIIAYVDAGAGPSISDPFPIAGIYFQKKNKTFTAVPALDQALNDQGHNQTIKDVIQYVSKQRINVN